MSIKSLKRSGIKRPARLAIAKISAYMAISFAIVLSIVEAIRNWGNWQWWPFWVIDYIVVILLISGAVLVLRKRNGAGRLLTFAWGVTFGSFYMSFWSHIENFSNPAHGNISQAPVTYLIGLGLLWSIVGFILSLSKKAK